MSQEEGGILRLLLHLTGAVGKPANTLLNCPDLFQTFALLSLNCGPSRTHTTESYRTAWLGERHSAT